MGYVISVGRLRTNTRRAEQKLATRAKRKPAIATHWVFHNNCPYVVYWIVQYAVGRSGCGVAGRVTVEPGRSESRNLPSGGWEIDGPYRRKSGRMACDEERKAR